MCALCIMWFHQGTGQPDLILMMSNYILNSERLRSVVAASFPLDKKDNLLSPVLHEPSY